MLTLSYPDLDMNGANYVDGPLYGSILSRGTERSIYSIRIGDALAPVIVNGFKYKTETLHGGNPDIERELRNYKTKTRKPNTISYVRAFIDTQQFEHFENILVEQGAKRFINLPRRGDLSYVKKVCQDTNERNTTTDFKFSLAYDADNLIVYELITQQDLEQASDVFLTIGLLPIFFPTLKEKLDELELIYFKELVRRSQLKRINNADITAKFKDMIESKKYKESIEDVRLKRLLEHMVEFRKTTFETKLTELDYKIRDILYSYDRLLNEKEEVNKNLAYVNTYYEDAKESLTEVLNIKSVVHIEPKASSSMALVIKTPIEHYNPEEAEVILNGFYEQAELNSRLYELLRDIFVHQKYKLNVMFKFIMHATERDWQSHESLSLESYKEYEAFNNPHLQNYRCYGSYAVPLRQAHISMQHAIYATVATACLSNINFADAPVIRRFINDLKNNDWQQIKAIEDKEGNTWSIKELLDGHNEIEIEVVDTLEEEDFEI